MAMFVYEEDEQMHWRNHVLMSQDGTEEIDVERLQAMSWEAQGAGRISTNPWTLVEIAAKHGLVLRVMDRRRNSKQVPSEWAHLPLVVGATGNY